MKSLKGPFFLLAGLVAGVLLGMTVIYGIPNSSRASRPAPPSTGKTVQDFTLQDLNDSSLRLSSLRGKPVVINFWATWCVPCREEMPLLSRYADLQKDNAVFIAINNDEEVSIVRRYVSGLGIHFPVLLDPGGKINTLFYVQSYPNTFFIDSAGILRAQHIGQMDELILERSLQAIGIKP